MAPDHNHQDVYKNFKKKLLTFLLGRVFPKHIQKYKTSSFYPVILGGFDVMRCLSSNKYTNSLVETLFSSDIDMNFVIVHSSHEYKTAEDFERIIQDAMRARDQFIQEVITDPLTVNFLKTHAPPGASASLYINRELMANPKFRPFKLKIVRIDVIIDCPGEPKFKDELIDTAIYHSENVAEFRFYDKYGKAMAQPIPVYHFKGVPYATCKYVFFDTIRMLSYYHNALAFPTNNNNKTLKYNFVKFIKYILKFCALYIIVEKKNHREFLQVFEKARVLLVHANKYQTLDHVPVRMEKKLRKIIQQFESSTDLIKMQNMIADVIKSHYSPKISSSLF